MAWPAKPPTSTAEASICRQPICIGSLFSVPEQLENEETQEAYWELQKFLVMALKANPNVLECLYSPLVETATPLAKELLAIIRHFADVIANVYRRPEMYVGSEAEPHAM